MSRFDFERRRRQAALWKADLAAGGYVVDSAGATAIRVLADLLVEACDEIEALRKSTPPVGKREADRLTAYRCACAVRAPFPFDAAVVEDNAHAMLAAERSPT